jgi:uncharacterized membrane protein
MVSLGPLQLVLIELRDSSLVAELIRGLHEDGGPRGIRLVDAVITSKDSEGEIAIVEVPDLPAEDRALFGILSRSLFEGIDERRLSPLMMHESGFITDQTGDYGLTEDQLLEIADLIPKSSRSLFLLIEHLWALNMKATVEVAGSSVVASGLITPATLYEMSQNAIKPLD